MRANAGVFYRRAVGAVEAKKQQPTIPIPPRLLAHMRRWHQLGLSTGSVVEWNGEPGSNEFEIAKLATTKQLPDFLDVLPRVLIQGRYDLRIA
jgi:hypothetical protein